MKKKKPYQPPSLRKVRLDIKAAVLGTCIASPDFEPGPVCQLPGACVGLGG